MPFARMVLLAAVFFPYVQLVPSPSYMQPYALIVAAFLFMRTGLLGMRTMPTRDCVFLTAFAALGVALLLLDGGPGSMQDLKFLLNYVAPLLLVSTLFVVLRDHTAAARRGIEIAIVVWLGVALVEKIISPHVFAFLLGTWSSVPIDMPLSARGVVSLAPEPTHYAFHILMLGAAAVLLGSRPVFPALAVAQAVLLAQSSSAILALALGGALLCLLWPRYVLLLALPAAIVGGAGLALAIAFGIGGRPVILLQEFLSNPVGIVTADMSVNYRLGGLAAAFAEVWNSRFLPHGLSWETWLAIRDEALREHDWLIDLSTVGPPSGIGVIAIQSGIVGLALLLAMLVRMVGAAPRAVVALLPCTAPFVFMSQYYISAPVFSLVLASAIVVTSRREAIAAAPARADEPHRDAALARETGSAASVAG
ncbi:hypothetical protein [Salinarimonas rosea]|uniref:hypothetical protein n=1 Tax=Salinarimonas rosea TaxID=552063 RepID=UPI0003FDFFDE|nr:hypothetical protein [Salinarimonas rosea]